MSEPKRWTALITYITTRPTDAVQVEELDELLYELHDIVEHGPNWNEIGSITITLNRQDLDGIDIAVN